MDERSREVLEVLSDVRLPVPLPGVSRDVFLAAGAALLPEWAVQLLGRSRGQQLQSVVAARVLRSVAPLFRIALNDGISTRACKRVGQDPSVLSAWPELA